MRIAVPHRSTLALLLALQLSGCATHELVLSKTLQPALSRPELDFQPTLFRARVQMDRLEVWGRVRRSETDYTSSFDVELGSVATLCAALANSGLIFESDWNVLHLSLTNEYGSQLQWKTANGHAKLVIGRDTLMELGSRNAPPSEYAKRSTLTASKIGPPDYQSREWAPGNASDAATPRQ